MAARRRRSETQPVRVTTGKLEALRTVLARHWVPGLAPNAPDRALIDAALDIATVALVDRDTMARLARVKRTVPPVLPLIPFVGRHAEAPASGFQPNLEVDGEAVCRRLSGYDRPELTEVADDGNENTASYFVSGSIGRADLFLRDQPVSAGFPERVSELVREVVDHGGFILSNLRFPNEMSPSRRIVIAALFRRILITAEAVRMLTERGLEEPAIATLRTLSELEVSFRLVVNDATDRMARRMIYFDAVRGRRHFTRATGDAETRRLFQEKNEYWTWAMTRSRFFKDQLSSDEFEDIREECEGDQYWHGFRSQQEAFSAVGMSHDYHTLFDSASSFVHASNIDHDVTEAGAGVKAVLQADPVPAFTRLAYLGSNLTVLFGLLLEATGQRQGYGPSGAIVGDGGPMEEISAFELLQARVLSALDAAQRDVESGGTAEATAALAEAFSNQAVAVLKSGNLRQALEACSEVLTRFGEVRLPGVDRYVGTALLNKGYLHGELDEPEEAIAAYDEAIRRFGDSTLPHLQLCVAKCLRNKGSTLAMSSPEAARTAWDDLVERFGDDESLEIQVEVASALVKKAGSALVLHRDESAIASCEAVVARYDESEDPQLLRQVALALEMKGMAQNQLGLPQNALATYRSLVDRFGALEGDRGLPVRWRAMGIKVMALVLLGDETTAIRTYRTLCGELDVDNPVMLQKLVWDTIDLVARGASPSLFANALAETTERSEALIPLRAALSQLSGRALRVPGELAHFVDDIVRKITARTRQLTR